ncbi:hypothetical protein PanWU01x14_371340, partial [Parasponia andersonii]
MRCISKKDTSTNGCEIFFKTMGHLDCPVLDRSLLIVHLVILLLEVKIDDLDCPDLDQSLLFDCL